MPKILDSADGNRRCLLNGCVKELSEFENQFSTINEEPFALSQAWAITVIEHWNKKN